MEDNQVQPTTKQIDDMRPGPSSTPVNGTADKPQPSMSQRQVPTQRTRSQPKQYKSSRRKPRKLWLLIVLAAITVLLLGVFLFTRNSGVEEKEFAVGVTQFNEVKIYRSSGAADPNKVIQNDFVVGDPIQVGLVYRGANAADTIKFEVVNVDSQTVVYKTSQIRPNSDEGELFVDLNRDDLAIGKYELIMRDKQLEEISNLSFSITE